MRSPVPVKCIASTFDLAMGLRSALLVAAAGTSDAVRFAVGRAPQVRMGTAATDMGLPCKDECAVGKYPKMPPSVHPGVVTGQALVDLLAHAKEQQFAIPAVNCVSSSGINACLEAARACDAPIIIQFSSGGSQFYAGKGLDNTNYRAAIAGAVSGAYHVRATRTVSEIASEIRHSTLLQYPSQFALSRP